MRDILRKRMLENKIDADYSCEDKDLLYILKNSNNKKHQKDITIDLIEYLVSKRLKVPQSDTNIKVKKKRSVWGIALTLLSVVVMCIIIFQFFGGMKSTAKNEPFKVYENLNQFAYCNIYGRRDLLDNMVLMLDKIRNKINKCDEKTLSAVLRPSEKNFLFYGEPGTGKTLFIKVFSYLYDLHLKIEHEIIKCGGIEEFIKKEYTYEDLNKLPSIAVLITVQPSNLIQKYVGESEKNIERLFQYANENSKDKVVLIFIDEIDSFFSERTTNTTEHASNIKSQFLSSLDGTETILKSNCFLFGATNFEKNIDSAFIRRMGNHIYFGVPNETERYEIIKNYIKSDLYENAFKMNKLVKASKGMTPSNITSAFSELNRRKIKETDAFTFDEILEMFNEYKYKQGEKLLMPIKIREIDEEQKRNIMYNRFNVPVPG